MIRKYMLCLCLSLTPLLLSACVREEAVSYAMDDDNRHSLSLFRTAYPWSSTWEVKLVTAHIPECQRRHTLQEIPESKFKVEVFQPAPSVYILHQGKRWYVTEMGKCGFQQFEEPPPVPGEMIGQFTEQDEKFVFMDSTGKINAADSLTR